MVDIRSLVDTYCDDLFRFALFRTSDRAAAEDVSEYVEFDSGDMTVEIGEPSLPRTMRDLILPRADKKKN